MLLTWSAESVLELAQARDARPRDACDHLQPAVRAAHVGVCGFIAPQMKSDDADVLLSVPTGC